MRSLSLRSTSLVNERSVSFDKYQNWKERNWLIDTEVVRADRLETQNGKDDNTGVNGGGRVADGQDESVFDAIVPWRIVTAEGDERAEPDVERIEDLSGRV